jgi:hypothetical protein
MDFLFLSFSVQLSRNQLSVMLLFWLLGKQLSSSHPYFSQVKKKRRKSKRERKLIPFSFTLCLLAHRLPPALYLPTDRRNITHQHALSNLRVIKPCYCAVQISRIYFHVNFGFHPADENSYSTLKYPSSNEPHETKLYFAS